MRQDVDDRIHSIKQLVEWSDELLDSESQMAGRVVREAQIKWAGKPNTVENLEELRQEILHALMDIGIVAEFDPTPCFYGQPPIVEIRGKVKDDPQHKYGFDHEKKRWEVQRAIERNEEYLGQKEPVNSRRSKSGSKSSASKLWTPDSASDDRV